MKPLFQCPPNVKFWAEFFSERCLALAEGWFLVGPEDLP